ncbi:MAG: hypothetical protein NTX03_04645 [Bacteroidetes bacterium]|nr:hypothetical protein [Bacteroidota bacterium]
MLPKNLLRFIVFVKRLPFIRSIPNFHTIPANISPHNIRFYKLSNLVLTLGMGVHASWVSIFIYLELYNIALLNVASVLVYVFAIAINRKGNHFTSSVMMVLEIVFYQLFSVRYFGWNSGFQYYIVVVSLFPFLMPRGRWALKFSLMLICVFTFIIMDGYLKNEIPYINLPINFVTFFHISNIIFAFVGMNFCVGYFIIAMHETEDSLALKTQELIESEKKATLGKLATEMAHEIQNPLNFVNNFSEINVELINDLNEELQQNQQTEEALKLTQDLLDNSERINTNGKRISKIVSALQEQVDSIEKEELKP